MPAGSRAVAAGSRLELGRGDTSCRTRFSRSSAAPDYPKHDRSPQPGQQETPSSVCPLRITPYWRYFWLSDMSDNQIVGREQQSPDSDEIAARRPGRHSRPARIEAPAIMAERQSERLLVTSADRTEQADEAVQAVDASHQTRHVADAADVAPFREEQKPSRVTSDVSQSAVICRTSGRDWSGTSKTVSRNRASFAKRQCGNGFRDDVLYRVRDACPTAGLG
jgi:hypothetical protein